MDEAESLGIRPGKSILPANSFEAVAYGRFVGKALDGRVGSIRLTTLSESCRDPARPSASRISRRKQSPATTA
jgi:putative aminopeptidase FrvX